MDSTRTDEVVAQWWADRLDEQHAAKRAKFRAELLDVLASSFGWQRLAVDYDPDPILRKALNAVGIRCVGSFFSADGVLPRKSLVLKQPDGTVEAKEGYGAPFVTLATPTSPGVR